MCSVIKGCYVYALFLCGCLVFLLSACSSTPPAGLGVSNGRLSPCPTSPNCVCSEAPGAKGYVEPIRFAGDSQQAWERMRLSIVALGGEVLQFDDAYLWATFTSRMFGFVDDLELRLVAPQRLIHVRSAARLGYSDFGVNAARIKALRASF